MLEKNIFYMNPYTENKNKGVIKVKKIINGKKYDTDTAERVGYWDNGLGYNDFDWCERELYRKKTGEFFEFGQGGARSAFCESAGQNCWGSGKAITPLTLDEAKEWVERYNNDKYEAIFGQIEE